MAETVTLRSEIGVASFTRADDQRHAFRNVDPLSHQLGDLVGIVREQSNAVEPELIEDRRRIRVVSSIHRKAERGVRVDVLRPPCWRR